LTFVASFLKKHYLSEADKEAPKMLDSLYGTSLTHCAGLQQ